MKAVATAVFSRSRLIALITVTALCLSVYALLSTFRQQAPSQSKIPIEIFVTAPAMKRSSVPVEPSIDISSHEIQQGDTLGRIFSNLGFDHSALNAVLAADEELLALDVLQPGNTLKFERSGKSGELRMLSLIVHPGQTIHYRRTVDGSFEFTEELKPSHWRDEVVSKHINGSFYASAVQAGLNDTDIFQVQRILAARVNFSRDIKAGDWFEIVYGLEMVDVGPTGLTRIEAVRLHLGRQTYSAFLHDDGNYYDHHGESLSYAFLRYPTQRNYRVSSPFNPRRLHPVTKQIAPHHGVDFAMPTGTPILSVADGVITRVGNHPYAGKYIEIQHAGKFKTRYLHLSHVQVRQGEHVERAQRVARSGNSGRSTGPHLHFELHINSRPVDPLVAEIPTASSVSPKEMKAFTQRRKDLVAAMNSETLLTSRDSSTETTNDI
nr:peptidoglycan DD-metalloendopeptidase family protein [Comamonas koreensis]